MQDPQLLKGCLSLLLLHNIFELDIDVLMLDMVTVSSSVTVTDAEQKLQSAAKLGPLNGLLPLDAADLAASE